MGQRFEEKIIGLLLLVGRDDSMRTLWSCDEFCAR